MTEGISAVVTKEPDLAADFAGNHGLIIKKFKPPYEENRHTREDYLNEVRVLQILDAYRGRLPFSIPQLVDHGFYSDAEDEEAIAFIRMSELQNPLSKTDMSDISPAKWVEYSRIIAPVSAAFHQLPLNESERQNLTRDPLEYILNRINRRTVSDQQKAAVESALSLADEFEGPFVFVHGDLGPGNLFGESLTSTFTGVCDFCFSGLGPKELDFCSLPRDNKARDAFVEGYVKAGGDAPNPKNLAILEAIFSLLDKLEADHRLEQNITKAQMYLPVKIPLDFDVPSQPDGVAFEKK